jgi:LysR family glycine cleavage system transcriptional activator
MPRLGDFQADHADIDLRISADDALIDFDNTDFHAAIRFGPGDPSGPPGERLMGDWILPVCSHRYFERHGTVRDLDDLARREMMYVESDALDAWFRFAGEEARERRVKVLNDALAILMAAELGEGIALTRWSLVARDLAAGRFVRPVPTAVPSDWSYWFVTPSHQQDMPKVRAFQHWLAEECARFDRAGPGSPLNVTD